MSASRIKFGFVSLVMASFLAATVGCETASDSIPTKTSSSSNQGTSTSTGAAGGGQQHGPPGEAGMQGMDPSNMAGMAGMMGDGSIIDGGAPGNADMTSEYVAQSTLLEPGDVPAANASEMLEAGGFGTTTQPGFNGGAPEGSEGGEGAVGGYLESGGAGFNPYTNPENFDVYGSYIGPVAKTPKASARPQKPVERRREDVLRNRNQITRQVAGAAPKLSGSRGGSGTGQQAVMSIRNPVMNYDGTGFAIGFGADYQILRAPEEDTQYVWVVSFTELSKTGTGSRPRLVNTPIKLQDSGSLRVVVPLQGQPKGPFKCMVAAKKGGRIQQVTKWVSFPQRSN